MVNKHEQNSWTIFYWTIDLESNISTDEFWLISGSVVFENAQLQKYLNQLFCINSFINMKLKTKKIIEIPAF